MAELSSILQSEEVTTIDGLQALEPEWSALWARARRTTPFQSPQWLIPFWRHLGSGELLVLAFRQQDRLIGLLPLIFERDSKRAERKFVLLGGAISDYHDAVFANGFEAAGLQEAWAWLESIQEERDVYEFGQLPDFSPLLHAPLPAGWIEESGPQESCPVLRLSARGIADSIPPHQLANLRYYRKRAERLGRVKLQQADGSNVVELMCDLLRLHSGCWSWRGEEGVLAHPAVARFHREAAPALLGIGIVRLYVLRIGSRAVAALYGFMHHRRFYYYIGGFDPEFKNLSPGSLLVGHAIERAISEGAAEFDFLRGCEKYKYLWGAKDRIIYRRILQPPPAPARRHAGRITEGNFRLKDKDVRVF